MYKCCMHKNYGKFSARKHNIDAFSGSNAVQSEVGGIPTEPQDCVATMDSAYNLQRTE